MIEAGFVLTLAIIFSVVGLRVPLFAIIAGLIVLGTTFATIIQHTTTAWFGYVVLDASASINTPVSFVVFILWGILCFGLFAGVVKKH